MAPDAEAGDHVADDNVQAALGAVICGFVVHFWLFVAEGRTPVDRGGMDPVLTVAVGDSRGHVGADRRVGVGGVDQDNVETRVDAVDPVDLLLATV